MREITEHMEDVIGAQCKRERIRVKSKIQWGASERGVCKVLHNRKEKKSYHNRRDT